MRFSNRPLSLLFYIAHQQPLQHSPTSTSCFLHLILPLPSLFYLPSYITPSHHHRHTITDTSSSTQDHASKHGTQSEYQVTINPQTVAAAAAVAERWQSQVKPQEPPWAKTAGNLADSEYRRLINTCLHRLPPQKAVRWSAENLFCFSSTGNISDTRLRRIRPSWFRSVRVSMASV